MNDDGRPDLFVGNDSDGNRVKNTTHVYLNKDGMLQTIPAWSFTDKSTAWGDIDGDGDLDLVVGNRGGARLYINNRALADASPYLDLTGFPGIRSEGLLKVAEWNIKNENGSRTTSVAWGDMNGDGRLDLAVGNAPDLNGKGGTNQVYLNNDGVLQTTPAWSSNDMDPTQSVAWGDIDNDGDLDLAVGNKIGSNKIYFNENGNLKTIADWSSDEQDNTLHVAWGDIDYDGDLDLVAGNSGSNKLYLNHAGKLATTATWSSDDTDHTNRIALGDMNGDGYLDLATSNMDKPSKVYLNIALNGTRTLQATADWTAIDSVATWDIAWKDADNDGDLDLVVAIVGDINHVYQNAGGMLNPQLNDPCPNCSRFKQPDWVDDAYGWYGKAYAWGMPNDGHVFVVVPASCIQCVPLESYSE